MIGNVPIEVRRFFDKVSFMAFGTVDNNGVPNVVAIGSKKIVGKNKVWVIDTYFDKTKQNLERNPNVSITMWYGLDGYQMKGKAQYFSSGDVFDKAKKWILKLKPGKKVKGVVEVKITDIYSIRPKPCEAGKKIV
jgi:predicted pyridoxine 5'-phosphate oxidase superfamily flavin-nucleotide-binding protein